MSDEPALDSPGNRRRFLNQVARGRDHEECAVEIGTTIRTVQRYARDHGAFKGKFKEAKSQGKKTRRAPQRANAAAERKKADAKRARAKARAAAARDEKAAVNAEAKREAKAAAKREAKRAREGLKELARSAEEGAPQAYLEEMELAQPQGLNLNPHLPPLSVQSHLGMCQRMAYDKSEPSAIRREAMRQIGMHTLLPALRPPPAPPRNETGTVAEAQQPALAIPGAGPRVVVLKAPDNGMYAPGCGPGDATVVDEAEAADAELVTPG